MIIIKYLRDIRFQVISDLEIFIKLRLFLFLKCNSIEYLSDSDGLEISSFFMIDNSFCKVIFYLTTRLMLWNCGFSLAITMLTDGLSTTFIFFWQYFSFLLQVMTEPI